MFSDWLDFVFVKKDNSLNPLYGNSVATKSVKGEMRVSEDVASEDVSKPGLEVIKLSD